MLHLIAGLALIGFVAYQAADHVLNRYMHSRKSLAVLGTEAGVCLAVGLILAFRLAAVAWYFQLAIAVLIALPLCTVATLITVEVWRLVKQGEYDAYLNELRGKLQELQEQSDRLTWDINRLERQKEILEKEHNTGLGEQRALEALIQSWQQGEGLARIRALRVEEWQRNFEQMSQAELTERRASLRSIVAAETDEEARNAAEVESALVSLALLDRRLSDPNRNLRRIQDELQRMRARKEKLREEGQELDREIRRWLREKSVFVNQKITLD